jgi:hypothetical protein
MIVSADDLKRYFIERRVFLCLDGGKYASPELQNAKRFSLDLANPFAAHARKEGGANLQQRHAVWVELYQVSAVTIATERRRAVNVELVKPLGSHGSSAPSGTSQV